MLNLLPLLLIFFLACIGCNNTSAEFSKNLKQSNTFQYAATANQESIRYYFWQKETEPHLIFVDERAFVYDDFFGEVPSQESTFPLYRLQEMYVIQDDEGGIGVRYKVQPPYTKDETVRKSVYIDEQDILHFFDSVLLLEKSSNVSFGLSSKEVSIEEAANSDALCTLIDRVYIPQSADNTEKNYWSAIDNFNCADDNTRGILPILITEIMMENTYTLSSLQFAIVGGRSIFETRAKNAYKLFLNFPWKNYPSTSTHRYSELIPAFESYVNSLPASETETAVSDSDSDNETAVEDETDHSSQVSVTSSSDNIYQPPEGWVSVDEAFRNADSHVGLCDKYSWNKWPDGSEGPACLMFVREMYQRANPGIPSAEAAADVARSKGALHSMTEEPPIGVYIVWDENPATQWGHIVIYKGKNAQGEKEVYSSGWSKTSAGQCNFIGTLDYLIQAERNTQPAGWVYPHDLF